MRFAFPPYTAYKAGTSRREGGPRADCLIRSTQGADCRIVRGL